MSVKQGGNTIAGGGVTPDNMVTTDTAQTISGFKTISNDGAGNNKQMDVVCENLDLNNLPSSNAWGGVEFQDANGTRIAKVEPSLEPSGIVRLNLTVSKPVNGTMKYGMLAICIKPDGTVFTEAPTPASSDNSTKIATTAFVKSSSSGYSTYKSGATISSNTDYTVPNNGVIAGELSAAQGGTVKVNIGGVTVEQVGSESSQRCRGPFYAIVKKGQVVKLVTSGNAAIPLAKFYAFS